MTDKDKQYGGMWGHKIITLPQFYKKCMTLIKCLFICGGSVDCGKCGGHNIITLHPKGFTTCVWFTNKRLSSIIEQFIGLQDQIINAPHCVSDIKTFPHFCTLHLIYSIIPETMMPDPFHMIVGNVQYKIYVSYGEYETWCQANLVLMREHSSTSRVGSVSSGEKINQISKTQRILDSQHYA